MLYGNTLLPLARWLFALTASITAKRVSARSGASFEIRLPPKGASKIARPSLSITFEIATDSSPRFGRRDNPQALRRLNTPACTGRGELCAIPAMFDYYRERDPFIYRRIIRRKSRKPRVRLARIQLRRPRLSPNTDINSAPPRPRRS